MIERLTFVPSKKHIAQPIEETGNTMTVPNSRRTRLDIAYGIVSDLIQHHAERIKIEEESPAPYEPLLQESKKALEELNEVLDSLFSLDKEVIERTIEKYEPILKELKKDPFQETLQLDIASNVLGTIIGCHALKIAKERKKPNPDRSLIAASEKVMDEMEDLRDSLYLGGQAEAERIIREYGPLSRELWRQGGGI
jgi:hypothetical protein